MYAEYTYAPSDRILNGFIQALVGLYDYTADHQGPARAEAVRSRRRARRARRCPHYDTGAWSLYDQFGESNLNYHELLTEFLQHLCERTRKGPPIRRSPRPRQRRRRPRTTAAPPRPPPADATGGGSRAAHDARARPAPPARPRRRDATPPPRRSPAMRSTARPRSTSPPTCKRRRRSRCSRRSSHGGTRAGVQISLSKISTVRLTVRQGSRVVWTNSALRRTRQAAAAVGHARQAAARSPSAHRDATSPATSPRPSGTIVAPSRRQRCAPPAPRLDWCR